MQQLAPNIELVGKTELLKMFHELRGTRGFNTTLKRGLTEAAIPIQDTASRLSPFRTGALQLSYSNKFKRGKGRDGGWSPYVVIGADTQYRIGKARPCYYLHLIEKGVRPHSIGKGNHPGFPGFHMLQRSMETNKSEAASIIEYHMRDFVDRIMKKRAKKALRMQRKIDRIAKKVSRPTKRIAKSIRKTAKKIAKKF